MDEIHQNGSTAVAKVPIINGELEKGPEEGPKILNGPHHLEKTDQEMNGNPEQDMNKTSELSKDVENAGVEVEKTTVEKVQNGGGDISETTVEKVQNGAGDISETTVEKVQNGAGDISETTSELAAGLNKEKDNVVPSGDGEKSETDIEITKEISNTETASINGLDTDITTEADKSQETCTAKSESSADVEDKETVLEKVTEQNEDLKEDNDSVEDVKHVDGTVNTSEGNSEELKAEQNESDKNEDESVVSCDGEVDKNDTDDQTANEKDRTDTGKEKEIGEKSVANELGNSADSKVDISMTGSEDLNSHPLDNAADESQNMSVESSELSKEGVLETDQESAEELSLRLSEGETITKEEIEKTSSDKTEKDSLESTVNETHVVQGTKVEKVEEDTSDSNGSKTQPVHSLGVESQPMECEAIKSSKQEASEVLLPIKEKQESKVTVKNSKIKSKTLDQVLSKITSIAENEIQQKAVMKEDTETPGQNIPKKAKARKSFGSVKPTPAPSQSKPAITSLTFNVKELEKQGLLDIPKAQKRKAFEPMKLKSGLQADSDECSAASGDASKPKSPAKSPGKTDKPSTRKKRLIRKKKGKRGGYLLPGEKPRKKGRKKGSEGEGEAQFSQKLQENIHHAGSKDTVPPLRITQKQASQSEPSKSHSETVSPPGSVLFQSSLGKSQTVDAISAQNSVLNVLTVTNRPLSAQTPSSSAKKAKKSMKAAETMRKIDSFFIGGNHSSQAARKPQSPDALVSTGSPGSTKDTEVRKRKAQGSIPSPNPTPEEKKRKMDDSVSTPPPQPQLIRLVPTGPPAANMSAFPGSANPILLTPGTGTGSQTIIQNGTLNGLPMFQIVNGPNGATSQPQQLVAIGPGQGQSLLQTSFPRTTTLLQTSRVPLILGPVSLQTVVNSQVGSPSQVSSAVISSASLLTSVSSSIHGTRLVPASSVLSGQQCSEMGFVNPQNQLFLSNGQLVDSKLVSKNGSLPNGLYPVTPPKTPENNSVQESRETVELSPGGTALPDKDVIPLCTCKINGANFQKLASLVTYCQALDSVDGKVMGCCNKVTSTQVVRPAVKVPFLSLCESHRKRLRVHQCCPGCGHFCTQGRFLQCKKDGSNSLHLFHEQCLIVKDAKNYCPHCGETSAHMEVQLSLEESKPSIMKESKSSRVQLKARITAKTASMTEETVEEPTVSFTFEKTKKTISSSNVPIGPDKHSLEKVLTCLGQERPKKFRHLPKCLYTPAYDKDLERTLYMLEDGHNPNEKYEDLENQGALHAAATVGSLPVVHVLVQAGATPHIQDKTLRTPLMYAAENNHLDVVKYLVKAGSIVDSKADDGMTALHYAAKAGHIDVLSVLLDSERIMVDVTDDGGWTPLIWAVEHDQTDSVKLLLKRNADPNLRDSEENTTLHWAAFAGSVVIAEMLLTAGCDLDSLNMHGDRPVHIAARQDHYECVVLFLARGADVEAKNNKSESPEECCPDKSTAVYLALKVNRQLKKFGAKHMGRPEKLIHRDLSKGRENIPIPCVNAVDDDGVPQDYLYVTDNIETTSLHINRVIGSLQSCQCKDDCSSIYCACGKNSVRCWYDKFGRLVPEFNMVEPPLIFECNRACTCWTTCNNRVVQNGVMSRLQVFKTDGRGWGCKTLVDIQRGTFICEYIGEHISDSEADRREDDSYLFDLDNRDGETYCIDARKYGNIARFINHLCEPNLVPVKVFVDSQDLRFPRICLFASRDIMAGEELGFDYGEKFWIIKWKHFTCTCGSHKCRYSKETIQKTLEEYYLRHDDEEAEVVNEGQTGIERALDKMESN